MQSVDYFQDVHSKNDYSTMQQETIKKFKKLAGTAISVGEDIKELLDMAKLQEE
ncbi:MAG TPA: hypothetical protein GXX18_00695 [Bacillales bacterium]|nr:hypothetical protein [Bacillales bacterium]